jgi:hypothetical protein
MSLCKRGFVEVCWDIRFVESLKYLHPEDATVGFSFIDDKDLSRYKGIINADISRGFPNFIKFESIEENFKWLSNRHYAVSKMCPGNILPYHIDKYSYFKSSNNLDSTDSVIRVIVFLEDQKSGHVLEIDGTTIDSWKAGEWVSWSGDTPHLAANLGHENRYTLQITGIIDENRS